MSPPHQRLGGPPTACPPPGQRPAAEGKAAELGEHALVANLRAGDPGTFARLYQRHQAGLLRLARRFVQNPSVAEEVVQETWIAVLEGAERFQGRSTLKTWIYRILANQARSRRRREGRSRPFAASAGALAREESGLELESFGPRARWLFQEGPAEYGPPERAADAEFQRRVLGELRKIPPKQAAVVVLRDMMDWTSVDVCRRLDISEANQRVLLHRGRRKLRQVLDGGTVARP